MNPQNLILFIYRDITDKPNCLVSLQKNNFLIDPIIVNDMPWRSGYFQTYNKIEKYKYSESIFENHCLFNPFKNNLERYTDHNNYICNEFYPLVSRGLASAFSIAIRVYSKIYPNIKILD